MPAPPRMTPPPRVKLLEAAAAHDAALVEQLTDLVNGVYAAAEEGLWREGFRRTMASEVAALIRAGELAIATRRERILAAAPDERGTGYRLVHTVRMDVAYPHLAPLLATPCDLEVREKPIGIT